MRSGAAEQSITYHEGPGGTSSEKLGACLAILDVTSVESGILSYQSDRVQPDPHD